MPSTPQLFIQNTRNISSLDEQKKLFQICGIPNGFGPAMKIFTKTLKSPFSILRHNGHASVVFVDDSYLQRNTKKECMNSAYGAVILIRALRFIIHPEKPILIPTHTNH